jgi:nitroreductase
MTTVADTERTDLLRRAAARARLAPSVHNSQPWRFRLGPESLELRADQERRLRVLDPTGRHLMISCGCALFNARVSLAAARREVNVLRCPQGDDSDAVARIELTDRSAPWTPLVRLDPAIDQRHSNRRAFFERSVPEEIVYELVTAVAAEDAVLHEVEAAEHRHATAELTREADAIEAADPAYREELAAWTSDRANRPDGVPALAFPQESTERGDVPIRDFGIGTSGWMPPVGSSDENQCLLILGTAEDRPMAWLRAGEALERMWLEATRLGYVASLFTQVVEVESTRDRLRAALGLDIYPHALIRVGQAAPNLATNRRDLGELVEETGG